MDVEECTQLDKASTCSNKVNWSIEGYGFERKLLITAAVVAKLSLPIKTHKPNDNYPLDQW